MSRESMDFWKEVYKLSYHKTCNARQAKKDADEAVKAFREAVDLEGSDE